MGAPSLAQVLDFLEALASGSCMDRGKGRVSKGMGALSAMRFVAWKLELKGLRQSLDCQLVRVWPSRDKWHQGHTREAIPLSLQMVKNLEIACSSAAEDDLWLILCFLLMIFGSLRWSDAQRMDLASVVCDRDCLYGWSWRCKQDSAGMPWGVVCEGVSGGKWGHMFFRELARLRSLSPSRDFLIGRSGSPIGYSTALAHFRRCLVKCCGLTLAAAAEFTMHSMKCTFLTWAQQAGVGSRDSAAQGHHREPNVNKCVSKYGRDDVLPQLRCQRVVLDKLATGWEPFVPLRRGTTHLLDLHGPPLDVAAAKATGEDVACNSVEQAVSGSDTEVSEDEDSVAEGSVCSNCDSDEDSCCDSDDDALLFDGPWVVNNNTGWYHKAVPVAESALCFNGQCWGLACRPKAKMEASYRVMESSPGLQGLCCGHSGCGVLILVIVGVWAQVAPLLCRDIISVLSDWAAALSCVQAH